MLYGGYQKGFLPDSGSFLDQSQRFLEYMDLIGEEVREQQEHELERQKKKNKRK